MDMTKMNCLNRFFTRDMLRTVIDDKKSDVYRSVINRYISEPDNRHNKDLFGEVYNELRSRYRNEYYYKNTLLNKLLLGMHSVNTTTALTEVPVAKSKADFVLINGKASVYEIKTELDNLDRLRSQLEDYYKAFDHVSVVTHTKGVQQIQKIIGQIDKPIGVYVIRDNGKIGTIQDPIEYRENLDKETIFKILRKKEYEEILLMEYGVLPNVSQFKYYAACKGMFLDLDVERAYQRAIGTLKKRIHIEKKDIEKVPYELKFLVYFMNLSKGDYQKLDMFLEKQFGGV